VKNKDVVELEKESDKENIVIRGSKRHPGKKTDRAAIYIRSGWFVKAQTYLDTSYTERSLKNIDFHLRGSNRCIVIQTKTDNVPFQCLY